MGCGTRLDFGFALWICISWSRDIWRPGCRFLWCGPSWMRPCFFSVACSETMLRRTVQRFHRSHHLRRWTCFQAPPRNPEVCSSVVFVFDTSLNHKRHDQKPQGSGRNRSRKSEALQSFLKKSMDSGRMNFKQAIERTVHPMCFCFAG